MTTPSKKTLLFILGVLLVGIMTFMLFGLHTSTPPLALSSAPRYLDSTLSTEERVADLLSYMTLEEKIGQMALVEKNSITTPSDIATYHLGGLLSGSGSKPKKNTAEGWRKMIDSFQAEAKQSRLGIPLLYGADAVHGHAHVAGATVFPHAIGLGAAGDEVLVGEIGEATARELAVTGVNWNFAPNLDLPQDIRWGRVYETFSDDPALASKLGAAYIEGLQAGETSPYVLSTAKHYIGLGSMGWGKSFNKNFKIDQGVTIADEELLKREYLPPFKAAIDAGALAVMAGLNQWGDKKMVLQKPLLTDVLRGELGFKGFVVSDWYGVHEGRRNIFGATVAAVNAGVDMIMLPFDYQTFERHMKWAHRLGFISEQRINEAAGRILYAKFAAGLFDTAPAATGPQLGLPQDRALARSAVAESLVLLKNEDVLPIKPNIKTIRIAGSAADNVGKQSGAWTIEWQGVEGNNVPGGTSILAGIQARAPKTTRIEFNASGTFATNYQADLGIAVVGEKPYAEGWGDRDIPMLDAADREAIKSLQIVSKQVVVIIVSGRPLFITKELPTWDGLVEAWLPGSEGAGVADVLFGDTPFTGTLPLPWPHQLEQLPIALDETTADGTQLLFPRYYGLR